MNVYPAFHSRAEIFPFISWGHLLNWITRTVDRLDQIKPGRLLLVDSFLALLVLLAQGGVLLMAINGKGIEFDDLVPHLYFTVALSVVVVASGLLAWLRPASRSPVLRLHAVLLLLLAAYALVFSLSILVAGIPRGSFVWNAATFAFILAYPVYLARRAFFPAGTRTPVIRYGHVLVAALSIVISAGIFWRMQAWTPSASDFADEGSPPDESFKVPRAQTEPAVPEVSWNGVITEDVVTLLSTSFESASGAARNSVRPFVQNGLLPWGRDTRAHSGQTSANVIPHGNPGDLRYFNDETISPVLLSSRLDGSYEPFHVDPFSRVALEFWRLSSSNPSETHNCLGSLTVDYRLDAGAWKSKMAFCGTPRSRPPQWRQAALEFDTAGHKTLELRFNYEYPPDDNKDRAAVYLVDDLTVRGYRRESSDVPAGPQGPSSQAR